MIYYLKLLWKTADSQDAWLELADLATTSEQRAYCVKQWQNFKPRPWYRKLFKIVLDFFRTLC